MMRLSEAIRMNGMMKPQGFGGDSIASLDAPCALGGALQSIGKQPELREFGFSRVTEAWPWSERQRAYCPACQDAAAQATLVRNVIWQLNDRHHWTRSQIADYVELIEPAETSSSQPSEILTEVSA
jgi:hypothetical protein